MLYERDVYSKDTFKPASSFGSQYWMSESESLCDYIYDSIDSLADQLQMLACIEILIFTSNTERIIIEPFPNGPESLEPTTFILVASDTFGQSLNFLRRNLSLLPKNPSGSKDWCIAAKFKSCVRPLGSNEHLLAKGKDLPLKQFFCNWVGWEEKRAAKTIDKELTTLIVHDVIWAKIGVQIDQS